MNYLGHAILSGDNYNILIVNILGDFVKEKQYLQYPIMIQKGLQYHRHIDTFTNKHPSIRAANKILRTNGVKYAGIFIDIFFDHFLANDKTFFSNIEALKTFTERTLNTLENATEVMTEEMKTYFGYMIRYNWLYHYHSREGIEKAIIGIVKRYPRLGNDDEILFALFNNSEELRVHYHQFIQDIYVWSTQELQNLRQ